MYLRLNTKFNPFTYDELVRPLADYGKAYKEVEDAYSTLSEQTEAFRDEVNQANSPTAYKMYKQYSDSLNTVVEDFSKGMTGTNRAHLLRMKRDYARNIEPIAKASEAMKAANALRDKAGPDAIFEVNRYSSLDDFLGGKTANNRYQSASAITSKTAAITEAVMKEALQDPEFKKVLGGQQYMITTHTGGSYEDLMAAIANNPMAQSKFAAIKKQVMKEVGYDNYDTYGQSAIESAVNTGLYAGLDKPVRQFEANRGYITPELRERQRQFDIELKTHGYDNKGNINPDSPYWRLQGLEYDKEKKTWKVVGKPGVQKPGGASGTKGSGSSARLPRLSSPMFINSKGEATMYNNEAETPQGGIPVEYSNLTEDEKKYVDIVVGTDLTGNYNFLRTEDEWFGNDAGIVIVPKKTIVNDGTSGEEEYAGTFDNG